MGAPVLKKLLGYSEVGEYVELKMGVPVVGLVGLSLVGNIVGNSESG